MTSHTEKLQASLARLNTHAACVGKKPDTIAAYATGNTRLLGAMSRRAAMLDRSIKQINAYLDQEQVALEHDTQKATK